MLKQIKGMINHAIQGEELKNYVGQTVTLQGSVYKLRPMSGFAFVLLRLRNRVVQAVYSPEWSTFPLEQLQEEACVEVTAQVVEEPRSRTGWELRLLTAEILSTPAEPVPVVINGKKMDVSLEHMLDLRPGTLRNEKQRAIFTIQAALCAGFRQFLQGEGFTEIHTPKIVYAGAEGGANIFSLEYFGRTAFLAQSPQFYKQMMVGVMERVFEIGPVFRAEKHDTSRHLNEYTGVDFEMGYIHSYTEIMEMETAMLRYTMEYLKENCAYELELLNVKVPVIENIPAIPFREAKQWVSQRFQRPITEENDLEPEEEKLICQLVYEETGSELVFITEYPSSKRPFYAKDNEVNPQLTNSFDLLFRGLEVTTGGQRIHSYEEQVAKMKARGMNVESFHSYLMAHKYGMPPHGGLGMGLERFTSRLLEQPNVRCATLFPRDIKRLEP